MIGETLAGRYAIKRLLGEGAMGSVYEASHTGTGRRVAVKVIAGDLAKHPNIVARFQVEARAAGVIDSQHIAQVLDVGHDEARGLPFMVMEFLSGEDLQHMQQRLTTLQPDVVARVAAQAAVGIARAHAAKIVHRDIKPGNIYMSRGEGDDRVVKLLDFGIAKIMLDEAQGAEGVALTRTGSLVGTPLYMSPEQARGDKVIDHRTDIWSLGVVMYQLLCGRTPHHHIEALGKLIIQICSVPATPLAVVAPWVPVELAAIVERCLAIEPEARFQSADEMLSALRALLPDGSAIDAAMLEVAGPAPLAPGAAGYPGTPPPIAQRGSAPVLPSYPPPGVSPLAPWPGAAPLGAAPEPGRISTNGALERQAPSARPPAPRSARWVGFAVVASLVGASGLTFYALRSLPSSAPASSAPPPSSAPPAAPGTSARAEGADPAPRPTVEPAATATEADAPAPPPTSTSTGAARPAPATKPGPGRPAGKSKPRKDPTATM